MKKPTGPDDMSLMIDGVLAETSSGTDVKKVVDVITFCEDPQYLNFHGQDPKVDLWPAQKIVLKMFYRGTRGNEHLQLTEEELQYLMEIGATEELDYLDEYGGFNSLIDKYHRWRTFTTFLLVMGRRSSKTMMTSIIAAYEAYKLLELGDPQKHYKMTAGKPIYIVNLAVSQPQALILFAEIKARITRSPYFLDKINPGSTRLDQVHLMTDTDKKTNTERAAKGISIMEPGTVVLMSGHSNSASLRGLACIAILFDEFAHFTTSTGKSSGDALYEAMSPSMKQFGNDGKLVLLSDPMGKEGMFWRLFEMSQQFKVDETTGKKEWPHDDICAIQLPTWRINPTKEFAKQHLELTEKAKNPVTFITKYGARFMGSEGVRFFDPQRIENCIDLRLEEQRLGNPRFRYFAHLDPATTSHNYALVLCHAVPYMGAAGDHRTKIFVDLVKVWHPTEKGPVNLNLVQDFVRDMARRFQLSSVTYDTFQSAQTIQNLRGAGVPATMTPYSGSFIQTIYGELKALVNAGDLVIYPHAQLIGEMKCLNYRVLNAGIKREFDKTSEWPSDDCVDALAGAVYQALQRNVVRALPRSGVVHMGNRR